LIINENLILKYCYFYMSNWFCFNSSCFCFNSSRFCFYAIL